MLKFPLLQRGAFAALAIATGTAFAVASERDGQKRTGAFDMGA